MSFESVFSSPTPSQIDDTECFSPDTDKNGYTPSQESFLLSPGPPPAAARKSPRKKLNEYLSSRDISPVRNTLSIPWDNASERTKRNHLRKARQVVHTCLEEIAPGESAKLFSNLDMTNLEGSNVDCSLMEALSECYHNAEHWSSRRQILSIMADKVGFKDLLKWIPTVTKYRYDIARHHILLHGRGAELPPVNDTRMCIKEEKLDHFLSFVTSSHIVQDLPFGEKKLKLSSGAEIKIPNVIRTLIPEQIIRKYQGYCSEIGFEPMSRSTLWRVLNVCSASTRKSLQGLDYFSAVGAEAFDELLKVIDKLGEECGKGLTWAKDISQRFKVAKRYLKCDYKVSL